MNANSLNDHLVVTILADCENRQKLAGDIVRAYRLDLDRVEIDFALHHRKLNRIRLFNRTSPWI